MLVNFLVNILTTNILFQISHLKRGETEVSRLCGVTELACGFVGLELRFLAMEFYTFSICHAPLVS